MTDFANRYTDVLDYEIDFLCRHMEEVRSEMVKRLRELSDEEFVYYREVIRMILLRYTAVSPVFVQPEDWAYKQSEDWVYKL